MIALLFGIMLGGLITTYLCFKDEITNVSVFLDVLKREYKDSLIVLGVPLVLIVLFGLFS